jgi:hypothetical protein
VSLRELESGAQHGSAAKAVFSLERYCPIHEHGSGVSDLYRWWRRRPEKDEGLTPLERLSKFR